MDTELLRTFLEVNKTRHFAKAAQNLFVTQAAVSARIHQLEGLVGQRLFTRSRNNIQLTVAGHKLVPYAESILASWNRALTENAFDESHHHLVVLGCLPSLREIFLDDWLAELVLSDPDCLWQVDSLSSSELVELVRENVVGLGILYEPPRAADLWVEKLTAFELLLISTQKNTRIAAPLPGYIYVDWGSSFAISHNAQLASVAAATVKLDTPVLARSLMLQTQGSAYLPRPMVEKDLQQRKLYAVKNAPVFSRDVYVIGRAETASDPFVQQTLGKLQTVAAG